MQIEALRERKLAEVTLPLCVHDGTGWAGAGALQGGPRVSLPVPPTPCCLGKKEVGGAAQQRPPRLQAARLRNGSPSPAGQLHFSLPLHVGGVCVFKITTGNWVVICLVGADSNPSVITGRGPHAHCPGCPRLTWEIHQTIPRPCRPTGFRTFWGTLTVPLLGLVLLHPGTLASPFTFRISSWFNSPFLLLLSPS